MVGDLVVEGESFEDLVEVFYEGWGWEDGF